MLDLDGIGHLILLHLKGSYTPHHLCPIAIRPAFSYRWARIKWWSRTQMSVVCCSAFKERNKTTTNMMMDYKPKRRNSCGVCLRYFLAVTNILFLVSLISTYTW